MIFVRKKSPFLPPETYPQLSKLPHNLVYIAHSDDSIGRAVWECKAKQTTLLCQLAIKGAKINPAMVPLLIGAILHARPPHACPNAKPHILPHCGILEGIFKAPSLKGGSFQKQGYLRLLQRQPDGEGLLIEISNWAFQISTRL